ncbi:MAG: Aldose 1-epimerase [Tenericutes bacterium ADurb.Bin087]|nr:MAG: Aldose 1-epimerase [Tenericutes bacterium ADurb.Bin087]
MYNKSALKKEKANVMKLYILENELLKVTFLDVGASIYSFHVKALDNRNIVLTTRDKNEYKNPPRNAYFGATVGRVGGRIPNGEFIIDGVKYHAAQNEKVTNSLHGGDETYAAKVFEVVKQSADHIIFRYVSRDGEGGYPSELELYVKYTLLDNCLALDYEARTTKKTLINIINHSYFNLNQDGDILKHNLQANVEAVFALDDKQINLLPLKVRKGDTFDLSTGKTLDKMVFAKEVNVPPMGGVDHLLVIPDHKLVVTGEDLRLTIVSDYPALQMYSTNYPPEVTLLDGAKVIKYKGLALEPADIVCGQNGVFKNLELSPGEVYKRRIKYIVELR